MLAVNSRAVLALVAILCQAQVINHVETTTGEQPSNVGFHDFDALDVDVEGTIYDLQIDNGGQEIWDRKPVAYDIPSGSTYSHPANLQTYIVCVNPVGYNEFHMNQNVSIEWVNGEEIHENQSVSIKLYWGADMSEVSPETYVMTITHSHPAIHSYLGGEYGAPSRGKYDWIVPVEASNHEAYVLDQHPEVTSGDHHQQYHYDSFHADPQPEGYDNFHFRPDGEQNFNRALDVPLRMQYSMDTEFRIEICLNEHTGLCGQSRASFKITTDMNSPSFSPNNTGLTGAGFVGHQVNYFY